MNDQEPLFEAEPVKDNIGLIEDAYDDAHGNARQFKDLKLNEADSLEQACRYAVGAASMCWEFPERAGIFQSEVALDVATQLDRDISRRLALVVGSIMDMIDQSMKEKRPVSQEEVDAWTAQLINVDPPNTMPEWLFWRFGKSRIAADPLQPWRELSDEDRLFWKHEAEAVERAVMRGGFKFREPGDV